MNLLGIDFEDWFHPELIKKSIIFEKKVPQVINGIEKILDWLDKRETFATFFVVGELIEFQPELFDKIINRGHEIGFHTMYHSTLKDIGTKENFLDELRIFSKLTNNKSKGFRAPTFSINKETSWAIDCLEQFGYQYDSSIVPVKTRMYGLPNAETKPYLISSDNLEINSPTGKIIEFPLLSTKFLGKHIPACGGFYLRTLPQKIIYKAIENQNSYNQPAVFFIHSWELTPEYMKKIKLPFQDHFITYHNLNKAFSNMDKLLDLFNFTSFERFIKKNNY